MSSIDSKKKISKNTPPYPSKIEKTAKKHRKNMKNSLKPERIRLFSIQHDSKTGSRSSSTSSIDSNHKKFP